MNAKDWQISEVRRQDIERAAHRHQTAATLAHKTSLKQRLGTWMIKTGQRLTEDAETIQADVHWHMTTNT